jgi:putative restriction endonuclease
MRYWWVNQNQTYKYEVPGGFLWSPKTRADGARNPFYETMPKVRQGDIVFSFSETFIKAIGIVQSVAETSPKPNFDKAGSNWANEGWLVPVDFKEIINPIKPKDFMEKIAPLLADKYAPLMPDGRGMQIVYLTEISEEFGKLLISLSNENLINIERDLGPVNNIEIDEEINREIKFSQIEGNLEKIQLVKSRRGQGIFKSNVRLIENHCRVTGVNNIKHLRASHIKPWSQSNDAEKLDGFNGLLLSPHIDHLFDKGFITFEDNGDLFASKLLSPNVLQQWNIEKVRNVGNFTEEQQHYLNFHREKVFKENIAI